MTRKRVLRNANRQGIVLCLFSCYSILLQDKAYFSSIVLRLCCKMYPINGASLFKEELIKLLLLLVGHIKEYYHIADSLLYSHTPNIHCTTLHVVAGLTGIQPCPLHSFLHLARSEALVDD